MAEINDDNLLDSQKVFTYLSTVSPVPFSTAFSFNKKIKSYIESKGIPIPEYNIFVNDDQVYKLYSDHLYDSSSKVIDKIYDVQFRDIVVKEEVVAVLWFGISKFVKGLPLSSNPNAGLRFKQWNIEVGNDTNSVSFFPDKRGTYYFIGEIHTLPGVLKANSRRDGFIFSESSEKVKIQLKNLCKDELTAFFRKANVIKTNLNKGDNYKKVIDTFNNTSKKGWKNEKEKAQAKAKIELEYEITKGSLDTVENFKEADDLVTKTLLEVYDDRINEFNIDSIESTKNEIVEDKQIKVKFEKQGINKEYFLKIVEEVLTEKVPFSKATIIIDDIKDRLA